MLSRKRETNEKRNDLVTQRSKALDYEDRTSVALASSLWNNRVGVVETSSNNIMRFVTLDFQMACVEGCLCVTDSLIFYLGKCSFVEVAASLLEQGGITP